jgi:hypothetical protein
MLEDVAVVGVQLVAANVDPDVAVWGHVSPGWRLSHQISGAVSQLPEIVFLAEAMAFVLRFAVTFIY